MLTDKEIKKISKAVLAGVKKEVVTKSEFQNFDKKLFKVVATKDEVNNLKEDVEDLRESVQALTLAVDGFVKSVNDLKDEYTLIGEKLRRHEKWIQKIAVKVGVELDYS